MLVGMAHRYAWAILLNELFSRQVPWDGYSPYDITRLVGSEGKRPASVLTMPVAVERTLGRAWAQEAAGRPAFGELVATMEEAIEAAGPEGGANLSLPPLPPDSLDALM